jgi:uncharacterized protein YodC (DUF2158 family)
MSNIHMSDGQDIPPEPRKLQPGDRVQLKGGEGPKMTVNTTGVSSVQCVYWNKDNTGFVEGEFHRDALAYFAEPVPGDETVKPPKFCRVGAFGYMELKARTVSNETLKAAIKNGRQLIFRKSPDYATLRACFDVIADEVSAHVAPD